MKRERSFSGRRAFQLPAEYPKAQAKAQRCRRKQARRAPRGCDHRPWVRRSSRGTPRNRMKPHPTPGSVHFFESAIRADFSQSAPSSDSWTSAGKIIRSSSSLSVGLLRLLFDRCRPLLLREAKCAVLASSLASSSWDASLPLNVATISRGDFGVVCTETTPCVTRRGILGGRWRSQILPLNTILRPRCRVSRMTSSGMRSSSS